jgi:hypothetical protein
MYAIGLIDHDGEEGNIIPAGLLFGEDSFLAIFRILVKRPVKVG